MANTHTLELWYSNFTLYIPVEFLYTGQQVTHDEFVGLKFEFEDYVASKLGASNAYIIKED